MDFDAVALIQTPPFPSKRIFPLKYHHNQFKECTSHSIITRRTIWATTGPVNMNNYKDGILLKINRFENPVFDPRLESAGFIEHNGQLIVFNLSLDYGFSFSNDRDFIEIETSVSDDSQDILDIRYYYVLENLFARFSPEAGWIWSDGKPDE